ncbi:hypothetical protein CW299_19500, partial [Pseudomonas aeruginosa]
MARSWPACRNRATVYDSLDSRRTSVRPVRPHPRQRQARSAQPDPGGSPRVPRHDPRRQGRG